MVTQSSKVSTVKKLKIITILLLAVFLFAVIAHGDIVYNFLSPLVAVFACLLIMLSKDTQGHYRRISLCYAVGICVWLVADICKFIGLYIFTGNGLLISLSGILFLIPNCFFALGLVFFTSSEYNFLHFQRMVLNTFAIAFFAFLIVQKLILINWRGNSTVNGEMIGTVLYFFVVVFTIVLVVNIFFQTKFTGHTMGTNFSAVFLVLYNLFEVRMIYFRTIGRDSDNTYIFAFYVASLVVYAMAQSDPALINRKPEPDALSPERKMKSLSCWINTLSLLVICIILYGVGFFDNRDLYSALLAVLAYVMVYKTIQANELSAILLSNQKEENARLEKLVQEKTTELKEMNDYLMRISTTDALTGLFNRRYGMQKIHELVDEKPRRSFALFQVDLNYFKEINDTYGHDAGDLVLKEVGKRLIHMTPEKMTAIRTGGDEFLLILEDTDSLETIAEAAEVVCRWMDEPVATPCSYYEISATIGISWFPHHTEDVEELLRFADQAMYSIKHQSDKSNYVVWQNTKGDET